MSALTWRVSLAGFVLGVVAAISGPVPELTRAAEPSSRASRGFVESRAGGEAACQFAIMAENNIGEDVWILFSESHVNNNSGFTGIFVGTDYFETMSNRRLAPGEKLNARYEVGGACGNARQWFMTVRIGPRGGETILVLRITDAPNKRTVHLGEAACWAVAEAWDDNSTDRVVWNRDEAAGCDPENTRYGLAPAPEPEKPVANEPPPGETGDEATGPPGLPAGVSLESNWLRVGGNNPRNNGIRVVVEGDRATLVHKPPQASNAFSVGHILWQGITANGRLEVRGSNGRYYPATIVMEGADRLNIDIDEDPGPGYEQTWERAGPSIDGDWVLVDATDSANEGLQLRVRGDRATLRFVPPTAPRFLRVGDELWRGIGAGEQLHLGRLEALSSGRQHETAQFRLLDEKQLRVVFDAGSAAQLWVRPSLAERVKAAEEREERIAAADEEDEDEGALLDLPREPVGDPSAQDPDLEPSDDMETVDPPELTPPNRTAACLSTSLPHDGTGITWDWGLSSPTNDDPREEALGIWDHMAHNFEFELSRRNRNGPTEIERSRISGFEDGFGYVWQRMSTTVAWETHRDLTAAEYDQQSEAALTAGRRPIDIEAYRTSTGVRFAGIWTNNPEDIAWRARYDLTGTAYGQAVQNFRNSGYRLIDMEAYPTPNGIRYAGVWYRSCDSSNWDHDYGMDRDTYQETVEDFQARGFRVIDFESYRTPEGQRYATVFEKPSSPRAWRVRSDRSLKWFLNYHHRYVDQGFRLIDYESYETADGIRYAGVWGANDARFAFPFRAALDDSIQAYRTRNGIPGVSVVVMQDDDVIYRRGFGWADSAQGKWAHSGTIYLTASIAKVIGATVAARLEEQGRLDLSDTTADILDYIGSEHTHTVAQLLGKVGCIRHYDTLFADPNQAWSDDGSLVADSVFYRWRDTAVARIESPLLPNCTPGRHYQYSTHGFTFVGAVLEEALGEDILAILTNELTRPFQLTSMSRAGAFPVSGPTGPVPYYDMAQGYHLDPPSGLNLEVAYGRSSWKVLGGGLQVDAMDLARFGWLTLDGRLVSDSVRDNRLWMSQTGGAVRWSDTTRAAPAVGLGWVLRNVAAGGGTRRVAEHGGTARGARSQLQIYRDANLVVAILTNQRNGFLTPGPASPNAHRARDFVDTVADVVLSNPPPP